MFTRTHHIDRHAYTEALESYRDPDTGRPRQRCLARWRAERSFAEEVGRTQFCIERAAENLAYYQGVIDRTVQPKSPKHLKLAPGYATHWRRWLNKAIAHYAALTAAREAGLRASDAEIERAKQAEAQRSGKLMANAEAVLASPPALNLTGLADRVRRPAGYNDPDAMQDEIRDIAETLDALIAPPRCREHSPPLIGRAGCHARTADRSCTPDGKSSARSGAARGRATVGGR
jgi:hypothetical protein